MYRITWTLVLVAIVAAGCGKKETTDTPADGGTGDATVGPPDVELGTQVDPSEVTDDGDAPGTDDGAANPYQDLEPVALLNMLTEERSRERAAEEVRRRGEAMVPTLREGLESDKAGVRAAAAFGLGVVGAPATEAVPQLEQLAEKDDDERVRDAARFAADAILGK